MFTPALPSSVAEAVVTTCFVASAIVQTICGAKVITRSGSASNPYLTSAKAYRKRLWVGLATYAGFMALSAFLYGLGRWAGYHNFPLAFWAVLVEQAIWLTAAFITVLRAVWKSSTP